MEYLSKALILFVAIEHIYILLLEMFWWTRPGTMKIFGLTQADAEKTKSLAANQGLYNGFLAAGLIWSLLQTNQEFAHQLQLFFVLCVLTAAAYGGLTVKKSILVVQGSPALLALISLLL